MGHGQRKRVLVTQGWMKHSLAIIRHLAQQGYEVHSIVPPTRTCVVAHLSRYTTRTHRLEQQSEDSFISGLLGLLRSNTFDVLVPVGYPVTEFVARHAEEIGSLVRFMSPGKIACEMAGDKLQMARVAESLGIATPKTYEIKSQEDLRALDKHSDFPIVIKGRHEGRGIVAYAASPSELLANYKNLCQRFKLNSPDEYPILQEYIPGWGCGFFAIYQNGVPKRIFMHRRVREYPVSGGASCCAESFFHEDLMALGRQLLDQLRWHGVAMVECRFDTRRNRFTLIEVNAKFWGSLELALKAGADFIGDYVRGALGESLEFSQRFKQIRFQWPFEGDLLHALENPKARSCVIRDFLNPWVVKGFHWTDPLPTLGMAYRFASVLVGLRSR